MRPVTIPTAISRFLTNKYDRDKLSQEAYLNYQKIKSEEPEISIVMPAYNEAENIVPTLASLCANIVGRKIEIIVVNNNSTDETEELVKACGVVCIRETNQGITNARNAGLKYSKGVYILNADADTIYPEKWIELMTNPLIGSSKIALTYGNFSFIPVGTTGRFTYFFYEYITDIWRYLNRFIKDEAVNVYGFNSGFRKSQGLQVEGFNHPEGTNEDGWLALKLRSKGFGKLHLVNHRKALVWTTDRRIQIDGGLTKGIIKRVKRGLNI